MGLLGMNPGSIGFAAPPDENEQLRRIRDIERAIQEMYADSTLRALVNNLPGQVATNVAAQLAAGISTTTVTTSSDVNVGNNGNVNFNNGTVFSLYALNNAVTSGYFALYVDATGRFGRTVSARRYKQDIVNFTPSAQAVFALQLREYRLKQAVEELGDAAPVERGLIAEELVACGLDWLVQFGADGQAEAIAYEKVALALIPVIQDHERRLLALEA